jgi:hypothetical protein
MQKIPLSDHGLVTVAGVCASKGWSAKTVQNWVRAGLLAAVPLGSGRGMFLLRIADVESFVPPPRGPKPGTKYKPRAEKKPARKAPAKKPARARG